MPSSKPAANYATAMNGSVACFRQLSTFAVCSSVCGGWEFCNETLYIAIKHFLLYVVRYASQTLASYVPPLNHTALTMSSSFLATAQVATESRQSCVAQAHIIHSKLELSLGGRGLTLYTRSPMQESVKNLDGV